MRILGRFANAQDYTPQGRLVCFRPTTARVELEQAWQGLDWILDDYLPGRSKGSPIIKNLKAAVPSRQNRRAPSILVAISVAAPLSEQRSCLAHQRPGRFAFRNEGRYSDEPGLLLNELVTDSAVHDQRHCRH